MFGILLAAVIDTAACYDQHITVVTHVEIVVYSLLDTTLAENHRNVNTLMFRARFDIDIDAADIFLRYDIYIRCSVTLCCFTVRPDII